ADPPLAALLGGGRPPLRRPARRLAHRHPRADDRGRLVPPLLAHPAAGPVHVELPAPLDRARGRGSRAPAGARDHEPLPQRTALQLLAEGPLPQLRRLDARLGARPDGGNRSGRHLARAPVRDLRCERVRDDRVALRRAHAPLASRCDGGDRGPRPPPPPPPPRPPPLAPPPG